MSKDTSNEKNNFEAVLQDWVNSASPEVISDYNQESISSDQQNIIAAKQGGTSLKLTHQHANSLPVQIWNELTHLKELDLSSLQHYDCDQSMKIGEFPEAIFNLVNLEVLNLEINNLTDLPSKIKNLTSLKRLNLSCNSFKKIPDEVLDLINLEYLDLGVNKITEIPSDIKKLTSLKEISLIKNKIESIPDEIVNLVNLESLSLGSTHINRIPSSIGNLISLRSLDLSENKIDEIPENIWNLVNLEDLTLQLNNITNLSSSLGKLTSLRILKLSDNEIEEIPDDIGSLVKLENLVLYNNNITTLPSNIKNLTSLKSLNLQNNGIEEIPNEMWDLINLEDLNLSMNGFNNISDNISNLIRLRELDISENSLTTVTGIDGFPAGCNVNANDNQISDEEKARLRALVAVRGSTVSLYDEGEEMDIDDVGVEDDEDHEDLKAEIIGKIVDKAPLDKKEDLQTFLESDDVKQFQLFLMNCPRTEGWKTREDTMVECLYKIADKMSENESVKAQCESLAETGVGSCGDRVSLAFVRMQLSLDSSDKSFEEMSVKEFYEHAKRDCAIKFLSEKADTKIDEMKNAGRDPDEIEVYLGYLRADLGLKLEANDMLYPRCSNVNDQELKNVKEEFESQCDQLVSKHIYADDALRAYCTVERIITTVGERPEFSSEQLDDENDADYMNRIGKLSKLVEEEVIVEIGNSIVKWKDMDDRTTEEVFFGVNDAFFTLDEDEQLFPNAQVTSSSSSSNLRSGDAASETKQTRKRDLEPDTNTHTSSSSSLKESPDNKRQR